MNYFQDCGIDPGHIIKRSTLKTMGNVPKDLPAEMVVEAVHRQASSFLITGRSRGPVGYTMSFHVMFPKGKAWFTSLRVVDEEAFNEQVKAAEEAKNKPRRGRKVEAKVESKRFLYHDSSTLATPSFAAKTVPSDERSGKRMVLADFLDD
jgi:hypothetical protein